MKLLAIIVKCLKEQLRSYWILLLTLLMGPFFIFVYYLIIESSKVTYDLILVNKDKGIITDSLNLNYGEELISYLGKARQDTFLFRLTVLQDSAEGVDLLKNKKADAMIIIPGSFSSNLTGKIQGSSPDGIPFRITGDLTSTNYLICALWSNELVSNFLYGITRTPRLAQVTETALGVSDSMDDFDYIVPGILILSLIMLMFTASIAFVSEVEYNTIMRLKLSRLTAVEFLGGVGIVQSVTGIVSLLLTLITAVALGFDLRGSLYIIIFVAALTSLSIIAFSLIIASLTRSANEVLIAGNFPMFLFMFFTGAAFPIHTDPVFSVAGYPVSVQSLMSPVHAISALNKILVMEMDFMTIIPEITSILVLTILYFFIGGFIFRNRHMRVK